MKYSPLLCIIFSALLCSCSANTQPGSEVSVEQVGAIGSDETRLDTLSTQKYGWGQGRIVNDKNQPISCIDFQNKYSQYGGVFIGQDKKNICLTFDEGYENGYTPLILDTLKQKHVNAIFFVTYDYAKRNPQLIKRMIDEGHTIGNHTWSHPSMPTLTVEKMADEIQQLHDYIFEVFGYKMTLFRPPMGEFSEQSLAVAQQLGYRSVFWSFAYKDYDVNAQPDNITALTRITEAAHNGGIYLLHAVSKTNAEILGEAINRLQNNGYTFEVESF